MTMCKPWMFSTTRRTGNLCNPSPLATEAIPLWHEYSTRVAVEREVEKAVAEMGEEMEVGSSLEEYAEEETAVAETGEETVVVETAGETEGVETVEGNKTWVHNLHSPYRNRSLRTEILLHHRCKFHWMRMCRRSRYSNRPLEAAARPADC